jgi:alpha-glucan phosphorylase-like protein
MNASFQAFMNSAGLTADQLMRFGREHPDNTGEPFTMTVLALRFCRSANGVSELHGRISRQMWQSLYPGTPVNKVPIGHVTNGIHTAGWTLPTASQFWTTRLGPHWRERLREPRFWQEALSPRHVTDEELWALRMALRRELIEFARRRLSEQNLRYGKSDMGMFDHLLSPDALTIGFARRFATYKRAPLFFRDFEWALRTLNTKETPIQLVFAGKAHPRDDAGKSFIREIINISQRGDLFGKVVFIEDYDINVARHLVAGADVWLNTPRRPMEASGTSGMKIAIHGGLHLSTMDGWWREAYDGHNGWKIGEDTTASSDGTGDHPAFLRPGKGRDPPPLAEENPACHGDADPGVQYRADGRGICREILRCRQARKIDTSDAAATSSPHPHPVALFSQGNFSLLRASLMQTRSVQHTLQSTLE